MLAVPTAAGCMAVAERAEPAPGDAADLNDIVVRRLLAAGLHLQGALGLLGDHPASVKICPATDELDQAIRWRSSSVACRG